MDDTALLLSLGFARPSARETAERDPGKEEADKVSERIVAVINDGGFEFTPEYYISIHAKLFKGVLSSAGKLHTVNIRKREWVLKDDSVTYGSAVGWENAGIWSERKKR